MGFFCNFAGFNKIDEIAEIQRKRPEPAPGKVSSGGREKKEEKKVCRQ